MAPIPEHIKIKLAEVDEIPIKVMDLCCKQLVAPNETYLTEISVRIGTMAQGFRSILNNMLWDFAEKRLKDLLEADEFSKIKWSHDYPIEKTKKKLKNSKTRILRHIKSHCPTIYEFIEFTQPYNPNYSLLWTIRRLSNDTSHTIPIKVIQPHISSIYFEHGNPKVIGDRLLIPWGNNKLQEFKIPCYIESFGMFISSEGKWKIFMIDIDQDPKFSVTDFISQGCPLISKIISDFYNVLKHVQ